MVTKNKDGPLTSPILCELSVYGKENLGRKKRKLLSSCDPGQNALAIYFVLILIWFTQSKTGFDF